MTRFVHLDYSLEHPGVARAAAIVTALGKQRRRFDATKGLATMLMAALVAALVVVADRLVDTWADGHLLAAWVVLWAVAFTALALFASSAKPAAEAVMAWLSETAKRRAQADAEAQYWASAQNDPRIMTELQAAISRSEQGVMPRVFRADPVAVNAAPARMGALKLG